jgi:2-polyprenyl-3-methyl-5-hydroxy-6-metoxy-1,4-benzoquinol methylase
MKPPVYNPTWDEEAQALFKHDLQEIWDKSISPQVWNQYHNQLDIYINFVSKKGTSQKVLDVGCAQATMALMLAEQGHEVSAIDIRPEFIEYARSRYTHGDINFIVGNVLDIAIDKQFDIIFANQIIEHLVYPDRLVKRLCSLLKSGGYLVITTPNYFYLKNSLPSYSDLGDVKQYEHLQFTADGDGHFFAYRGDELVQIFGDVNLKSISLDYFESPIISGHMKMRYLHRYIPSSILRLVDQSILSIPKINRYISHQQIISGQKVV